MYLGIAIGLFGIAIVTGSLLNLVFPFLYILICDFFYVRNEEKNLLQEFGKAYREYSKQTRRWL